MGVREGGGRAAVSGAGREGEGTELVGREVGEKEGGWARPNRVGKEDLEGRGWEAEAEALQSVPHTTTWSGEPW